MAVVQQAMIRHRYLRERRDHRTGFGCFLNCTSCFAAAPGNAKLQLGELRRRRAHESCWRELAELIPKDEVVLAVRLVRDVSLRLHRSPSWSLAFPERLLLCSSLHLPITLFLGALCVLIIINIAIAKGFWLGWCWGWVYCSRVGVSTLRRICSLCYNSYHFRTWRCFRAGRRFCIGVRVRRR